MPHREFVEVPSGFRQMVEELADLAILILDQLDGDADLEPNLAGSPFDRGQDLEEVCEDEGAQCDDEGMRDNEDGDLSDYEPSLGALSQDSHECQTQWGRNDPYGGFDHEVDLSRQ